MAKVRFRQWLVLQRDTGGTYSEVNDYIPAYADVLTLPAAILPIAADEIVNGEQLKPVAHFKVTIRAGVAILPTDRFHEAATGLVLEVVSSINRENLGGYLDILAKTYLPS